MLVLAGPHSFDCLLLARGLAAVGVGPLHWGGHRDCLLVTGALLMPWCIHSATSSLPQLLLAGNHQGVCFLDALPSTAPRLLVKLPSR